MKTHVKKLSLFYALFLTLASQSLIAQNSKCSSALNISNGTIHTIASHKVLNWTKFTASETSHEIVVWADQDTIPQDLDSVFVYSGSCSGLTQLQAIGVPNGDAAVFTLSGLNIGSNTSLWPNVKLLLDAELVTQPPEACPFSFVLLLPVVQIWSSMAALSNTQDCHIAWALPRSGMARSSVFTVRKLRTAGHRSMSPSAHISITTPNNQVTTLINRAMQQHQITSTLLPAILGASTTHPIPERAADTLV